MGQTDILGLRTILPWWQKIRSKAGSKEQGAAEDFFLASPRASQKVVSPYQKSRC